MPFRPSVGSTEQGLVGKNEKKAKSKVVKLQHPSLGKQFRLFYLARFTIKNVRRCFTEAEAPGKHSGKENTLFSEWNPEHDHGYHPADLAIWWKFKSLK